MRVLVYNIWEGGTNESGGDRTAKILTAVKGAAPDLLAVLEAKGFDAGGGVALKSWERELGMAGVLGPARSGLHVALFAKPPFRIVSAEPSYATTFMHACLRARVASAGGEWTVLVAHLNPFDPDSRLIEARHLAREAHGDRPVLLLGDFNGLSPRDAVDETYRRLPPRVQARHILVTAPGIAEAPPLDTRAVALLEWAGFTDVFRHLHPSGPGFTMPTKVNHYPEGARMRIDYIFATPPLAALAKSCEVHQTVETDLGSDHYPVMAEFEE